MPPCIESITLPMVRHQSRAAEPLCNFRWVWGNRISVNWLGTMQEVPSGQYIHCHSASVKSSLFSPHILKIQSSVLPDRLCCTHRLCIHLREPQPPVSAALHPSLCLAWTVLVNSRCAPGQLCALGISASDPSLAVSGPKLICMWEKTVKNIMAFRFLKVHGGGSMGLLTLD